MKTNRFSVVVVVVVVVVVGRKKTFVSKSDVNDDPRKTNNTVHASLLERRSVI